MQQQPRLPEIKQRASHHLFRHISQFFSLGCILLLVLSFVAACGGSSTASSSGSNGKITLTEMDYWSVPAQGATRLTRSKANISV